MSAVLERTKVFVTSISVAGPEGFEDVVGVLDVGEDVVGALDVGTGVSACEGCRLGASEMTEGADVAACDDGGEVGTDETGLFVGAEVGTEETGFVVGAEVG